MSTAAFLIVLIILGLLIVIVNIGTLVVLFTCKRLIKPANYPIISFLITGILQGLIVVPAYCIKRVELSGTWSCDVFRFSYFLCGHMLTLNVQLIAFDRVAAIGFPFKYSAIVTKCKSITIIIVTWVIFTIIDIIPFIYGIDNRTDDCSYIPWADWSISVIVLTIMIPLVTITGIYIWIWVLAIHHAKAIAEATQSSSSRAPGSKRDHFRLESRATKTSALLVGIFFVCWAPIGIYYMVENLCGDCITNEISVESQEDFKFAVKVISFTSCIFTPLAYCWRTREFKRELRQSLRKNGWKVAGISVEFLNRTAHKAGVSMDTITEHEMCATVQQ